MMRRRSGPGSGSGPGHPNPSDEVTGSPPPDCMRPSPTFWDLVFRTFAYSFFMYATSLSKSIFLFSGTP